MSPEKALRCACLGIDSFAGLDHNSDHHVTSAAGRRASALAPTLERGSQIPARGRTYDQRRGAQARGGPLDLGFRH